MYLLVNDTQHIVAEVRRLELLLEYVQLLLLVLISMSIAFGLGYFNGQRASRKG